MSINMKPLLKKARWVFAVGLIAVIAAADAHCDAVINLGHNDSTRYLALS